MRRDHCLRGPIGDSVRARRAEYILGLHGSRHLGGCGTVLRILPGYPRRQSRSHCLLTIRMINIKLNWVQIPLHEPFRISSGAIAVKDAIVVQYRKDGVTGWGEASPMAGAFYSQETPESTWAALQKMASADDPWAALSEFEGENFAKAGLAGAIIDRDLRARVERFSREGYRRVKVKIQPGWDVEPLSRIREKFPTIQLMVDANAAYQISDLPIFRELDRFHLMMYEQPLGRHALEDSAELARSVRTPVCADESAESMEMLEKIIDLRS